jgi:hypothetical protein
MRKRGPRVIGRSRGLVSSSHLPRVPTLGLAALSKTATASLPISATRGSESPRPPTRDRVTSAAYTYTPARARRRKPTQQQPANPVPRTRRVALLARGWLLRHAEIELRLSQNQAAAGKSFGPPATPRRRLRRAVGGWVHRRGPRVAHEPAAGPGRPRALRRWLGGVPVRR